MANSVTTILPIPSPANLFCAYAQCEGEAGTRSVPGGGASSKKCYTSTCSFTPSQPSPLKGEGYVAEGLNFLSPPPLRGRVREGGSLSWQMSAPAPCAKTSPMQNANSGMRSGATRLASASVASIPSAHISSISSALIANSSLKRTADSTQKNKQRMTPRAPHGLSSKAMRFYGFGTTTFSVTSKVLWMSFAASSLHFPSPLEGEVNPHSGLGGGASSKNSSSSFLSFTPSQPSPLKGEGFLSFAAGNQ